MSSMFPNGSQYAISKPLLNAVAISAITNTEEAVASTVTPPANGAILALASGWPDLDNLVVRASDATANGFTLEGVNTENLVDYPAGQGAGSYLLASDWTTIDQVAGVATSGGDQQYATWQYVNDKRGRQYQRKTVKNAQTMTLTLDYDPDKPWYTALIAADRSGQPVILRVILPNGYGLYYMVDPSFNETPTQNANQNMQNTASFALAGPPSRFKEAA